MARLTIGVVLACSLASSGLVHAETQAEIAARENEEGKELMFAGNYAPASAKFRDAVARVPEAKYFFNLCTSLYQEGKFGEALTACNSVEKNNADDKLKGKSEKLIEKIREEAKKQNVELQPAGGGGGDPNLVDPAHPPDGGNPTNPTNPQNPQNPADPNVGVGQAPPPVYAVGRPPSQGLFTAAAPSHNYTWTLGVDLFGGGSSVGQAGYYGTASGGVRFKADYLVNPAAKFGFQGYLQVTNVSAGSMDTLNVAALDIFDVGIAAYKHLCPAGGRLCFTPLAGIQLALMDPNQDQGSGSQTFNYAAFGARLEANLSYAFGTRYEYVVQAMLGTNLYTRVFAAPTDSGMTAADVGLDKGGAAGYFGLGFTYRFNTPFGQAPFVTLE